ncbi:MAG: glycosyltransferase [Candidatus Latescibacteria bacterium]|nr:glycosyltransferase [Candidatus Latescibacterota bacterium]NIM20872.1 glycosyltransferase [Candidatus Latescibacterota bacterium]NIM65007.1 glycosyltransferase [Candidatus Latescibacterota bacterium]NIO01522.1 glycosyltransferase [Candidatus Latescibacterota bacterium]NIO28039.1 glycosyltransferase [Candidatus Latescibacterota bacterium]
MKKLRIAFIGQKGLPARYGGVETHVENIATRLAAKGHEVWAYCRSRFMQVAAGGTSKEGLKKSGELSYQGVRLIFTPSIPTKHLDAASYTLLSAIDAAIRRRYDIIHLQGIGPSAFAPIPKWARRNVVSTVHALDWRQEKWGRIASWTIKRGESVGARHSSGVIAVSHKLVSYLREAYGVAARYIPNGATIKPLKAPDRIRQFGLNGNDYILAVGRIIPDRRLHDLIEAFRYLDKSLKLVIVGSETPRTTYSSKLEAMADERVIFTGDQFGDVLDELYSNCRLYVLASSVEGLPITVCEAMAFKRCVLLSDIPENLEVGGDAAEYFKCLDINSLHEKLKQLLEDEGSCTRLGERALQRVRDEYDWDHITEAIEAFYYEFL